MVEIRAMRDHDVAGCELVWHEAITEMRARFHLPLSDRTPQQIDQTHARLRHFMHHDPDGSFVAVDDDDGVVGLAQALVREELWVLSLFGVHPRAQDRGIARSLLEPAVAYAGDRVGLILTSRDPKTARRYARAGFDLHPAVTAWGRVRHDLLPTTTKVRDGSAEDAELVADMSRRIRGASYGPDLDLALAERATLLVLDGGGYALARDTGPLALGAFSEAAATELLAASLARTSRDHDVEVRWLTAPQQWAIVAALRAGLELHPAGPVMIRGREGPPRLYLPSGTFG